MAEPLNKLAEKCKSCPKSEKCDHKTTYELINKKYEVLLLEAQNKIVDSYFQYIEKKREPKDRFYMPRRKQLIKIGLVDALQGINYLLVFPFILYVVFISVYCGNKALTSHKKSTSTFKKAKALVRPLPITVLG
jgi:hypothetical protein